jgi:hypothetical protein
VLLDTTTQLPDGVRIRLRLPHATDLDGMRALHDRLGLKADELDVARALRFDPRRRAIVCATAWLGGAEAIVGYGAISFDRSTPDLLVVDEALAPGLRALIETLLLDQVGGRDAA